MIAGGHGRFCCSPSLRCDYPLSDDQIQRVAPLIFVDASHESRSERYSYILALKYDDPDKPHAHRGIANPDAAPVQ